MKNKYSFNEISNTRGIILGFATMIIVLFHSQELYIEKIFHIDVIQNILYFIKNIGNVGVDIFLVLSGVGLYYSFSNNSNLKSFYKKRFVRIVPAVFIVATIITALKNETGIGNFLERIFLFSLFTKKDYSFWYFTLIMILYIVYPLLHKLIEKFDYKSTILLVVIALLGNHLLRIYNTELYKIIEIATTRIPVFIIGIWIGKKSKEGFEISKLWMILFITVYIVILGLLYNKVFNKYYFIVRYLYCPLALTTVILLSYVCSKKKNKGIITNFLIWVGSYSMETYLLYEYLVKKCKNIFVYSDIYNISYHLCIFIITMILANLLKRFCDEINDKVFMSEIKNR